MNKHNFNWSNTFNSNLKTWWTISAALDAASAAGYPYLAWNGRIYDVLEHVQKGRLIDVGLETEIK